jgi:hypothetical protein
MSVNFPSSSSIILNPPRCILLQFLPQLSQAWKAVSKSLQTGPNTPIVVYNIANPPFQGAIPRLSTSPSYILLIASPSTECV